MGVIKGMKTTVNRRVQLKPIDNFDAKYSLTRKYRNLQKEYGKKIPKEKMDQLLQEAKTQLGIKRTFNARDFQKMADAFEGLMA